MVPTLAPNDPAWGIVRAIYAVHNPGTLDGIAMLMAKYKGHAWEWFAALDAQYDLNPVFLQARGSGVQIGGVRAKKVPLLKRSRP